MIGKALLSIVLIATPCLVRTSYAQPIQSSDWKPFITDGDERLWTLRWRFAASRTNYVNPPQYGFPRYRQTPFAVTPFTVIGTRPFPPTPYQVIDVRSATFVAPVQWRTASSEAYPSFLEGFLNFNARTMTNDWSGEPGGVPDLINVEWFVHVADDNGQSLVPINSEPERIDIDFRVPVRTHETVFDEQRARSIDWPAQWPAWTQPLRDPQPYIPSNDPFVGNLLNTWTDNAPHAIPPALLAKLLAARLIESAQPGVDSRAFWPEPDSARGYPFVVSRHDSGPFFRGFDVQNDRLYTTQTFYQPRLREAVEATQANAAVITDLYVALLRAAGIPARVIIGVLPPEVELDRLGGRNTLPRTNDSRFTDFRFWAEFYLWDEQAQRGQWIPVDVIRQREESSQPHPLNQPWRYFGNHDELDEIVPLTSVYTAGNAQRFDWIPAVWGWRPDPIPDFSLDAVLNFEVSGAVRRPGDPFGDIGVKRAK